MNKLFLSLVTVIFISCLSFETSFAQKFIEYKVNGVAYKAVDDQFISFITKRTTTKEDDTEQTICKYFTASISGIYNFLYTLEFEVNVDTNYKVKNDVFKLGESIEFYEKLPIAHINLIKHPTSDTYEFYSSEKGTKGNVTITKVDGDWIEGTFEGDMIPQYPLTSKVPVKVTEGKFRFPIEILD